MKNGIVGDLSHLGCEQMNVLSRAKLASAFAFFFNPRGVRPPVKTRSAKCTGGQEDSGVANLSAHAITRLKQ